MLLQAQDHTGQETLTAFGDSGEVIMGCPAEQIGTTEYMDSVAYGALIHNRLFTTYNFKLKVFMDSYNDEQRRKVGELADLTILIPPSLVVPDCGRKKTVENTCMYLAF